MKRYGRLWEAICSPENIEKAIELTVKGRKSRRDVRWLLHNREELRVKIREQLLEGSYAFSTMIELTVHEPKERTIRYPGRIEDRIIHHAVFNVLEPIFLSKFTADTYGSVEGRGAVGILKSISAVLAEHPDWYYVKTDIKKFYESIDHDLLKAQLRRTLKCKPTLAMLDKIIDSCGTGLAIGIYPSQYLANLYLSDVDHWAKEMQRVKHYYRYMDDIVALFPDKASAKAYLTALDKKLQEKELSLKPNARIAPVRTGIDFVGYVFFPTHIRLRKRIKERMKSRIRQLVRAGADDETFKKQTASYFGWCKHANCRHLFRTAIGEKYYLYRKNMEYKKLSDIQAEANWFGLPRDARVSIKELVGKEIVFFEYQDVTIKGEAKVAVKFAYPENDSEAHFFLTRSEVMKDRLAKTADLMPFVATVKNDKNYYYFE